MDEQRAAQAAYTQMGFLILTNVPKGSEFGLDGQFWSVNDFNGVKLIPPGLHLFVVSAAPDPTPRTGKGSDDRATEEEEEEGGHGGIGVRHALFKWYRATTRDAARGQVVVEAWDSSNEALAAAQYETVSTTTTTTHGRSQAAAATTTRTSTRKRTVRRQNDDDESLPIVSTEYLQTLDRSLAAYPSSESEQSKTWAGLSGYITEETVARVIGIDDRGVARVDALVEGWREQDELAIARERQNAEPGGGLGEQLGEGKTFWGKKRPQEEAEVTELSDRDDDDDDERDEVDKEGLEFARFDDKRSWPPGAVGPDLSRWSKDKSWLLSDVVNSRLGGNAQELLAELQLSFVLFTLVYNFSALASYKSLFSLICCSSLLAHPSPSRKGECVETLPSPLLESATTLPLFASFLSVVDAQMEFLEPTFFSTQLPSLESHLVSALDRLRSALSDASPHWYSLPDDSPAAPVWQALVSRWNRLAATTMEKFGWDLGLVEGSKARYGRLKTQLETDDGQVPFEELEEGEDAPVIVDLEDGDEDGPVLVGF